MKPLVLQMQAFGPFAQRQEIDFGRLGAKTFFLIHGPTGSGKTSILDAMCFALFGDSSGEERKAGDLRSQHAQASLLTEVTFDFALGERRYRVRRVPEQMRPARRGGGMTRQSHEAELVALQGEGDATQEQPLASGWERVTRKAVELLGFESRQFRQVIVLPQGRFFEFLKAGSQEREKILQVLFGTAMYRRIEEALKRAADDLQRQASECDTQRRTLLEQAEVNSVEALETRRGDEQQAVVAARESEAQAARQEAEAQAALQQIMHVAARFTEHDAAQAALADLLQQAPAWSLTRSELEAARRALTLLPYEEAWRGAKSQREEAVGAAKQAAETLEAAEDADDAARRELATSEATRPEIERLGNRAAELQQVYPRVDALESARAAQAQALERHTLCAQEAERAGVAASTAAQAVLQLQREIEAKAAAAAPAEACRLQVQQLQDRQAIVARQAKLRQEAAQADLLVETRTAQLVSAREAVQRAAAAREHALRRWVAGQAARIAHRLEDGQPCPVCGSEAHPAPASAEADAVSDEELQSNETALELATAAQAQAQQALSDAGQQRARHTGALEALAAGAGPADGGEIETQLAAARESLRAAEAAAKALATLRARQPPAQEACGVAEASLEAAKKAVQAAALDLNAADATLREREQSVPAELASRAALDDAIRQVKLDREALSRALDLAAKQAAEAAATLVQARVMAGNCQDAAAKAELTLAEKAEDLGRRVQAAGFADVESYAAALRDPAVVEDLAAKVSDHDQALVAAQDRAKRAEEGVHALVRPDVDAARAAVDCAQAAKVQAVQATSLAQAALTATEGFLNSLYGIRAKHGAIEERYRVLRDVADKANGQNGHRMSFQRYVLATLLDEVLAATTQRLRVMSRGRYEMRRRIEASDSRSAGGLDLEVFDHYTGQERGIQTLSGGESFLASLALALGLSDVVQSYAGGIRLDAIFVDEGFGTLDSEALDFAIRTLKDLQQAGRMVGIISHVGELKTWIDARLEVRPSPGGSSEAFFVV